MGLAPCEEPQESHAAPALAENVFRLAVHQRHNVDVDEMEDKVAVEFRPATGSVVRATVYVFAVRGQRGAGRCFAWAEESSRTTTIIHTALQSPAISDATQAVSSQNATAARRAPATRP